MKAVLCGALYPSVLVMAEGSGRHSRPSWLDDSAEVALHPTSLVHPLLTRQFASPYVMGLEKVRVLIPWGSVEYLRASYVCW